MNLVFIGLSVTSSWGNGHATTYRALLKALAARGHAITFLERSVPWYAAHRDLPEPPFCTLHLYEDLPELQREHARLVADADAVIVGSYVPEGVAVGDWVCETASGVTAFYDIDTPITLAKLKADDFEYLSPEVLRRFDLYLSFTGGPILRRLEDVHGAKRARALYCSVDPEIYRLLPSAGQWQLGYLGTYSGDRQPKLEALLLEPARRMPDGRFVVAGPGYPDLSWPANVERIDHLAPPDHPAFYASQRFTLNITRADMVNAGYSPSVRLFEAAACGVPIISDRWAGLDTVFEPGREIFVADTADHVVRILRECDDDKRREIGLAGRAAVLQHHTAAHRAQELEAHLSEAAAAGGESRAARILPAAAEASP